MKAAVLCLAVGLLVPPHLPPLVDTLCLRNSWRETHRVRELCSVLRFKSHHTRPLRLRSCGSSLHPQKFVPRTCLGPESCLVCEGGCRAHENTGAGCHSLSLQLLIVPPPPHQVLHWAFAPSPKSSLATSTWSCRWVSSTASGVSTRNTLRLRLRACLPGRRMRSLSAVWARKSVHVRCTSLL